MKGAVLGRLLRQRALSTRILKQGLNSEGAEGQQGKCDLM